MSEVVTISEPNLRLLAALGPTFEEGYEDHMRKLRTTPLDPVVQLHKITGAPTVEGPLGPVADPLLYGPLLRQSYKQQMDWFENNGINARPAIAATFLVNLLTEDNLPHYSLENYQIARFSPALRQWLFEWITEEHPHGVSLRDYGLLTGMIGHDIPQASYHEGLKSQLTSGIDVVIESPAQGFAYLALQEYLTYEAHKNLGWVLDPYGRKLLRAISGDEDRHYRFYSRPVAKLFELDPNGTMVAVRNQFATFEMPGQRGIPDYDELAKRIALSGIFDESIVAAAKQMLVDEWQVAAVECTTDEAKQAQTELLTAYQPDNPELKETTQKVVRIRDALVKRADRMGAMRPLILGRTVKLEGERKELVIAA